MDIQSLFGLPREPHCTGGRWGTRTPDLLRVEQAL